MPRSLLSNAVDLSGFQAQVNSAIRKNYENHCNFEIQQNQCCVSLNIIQGSSEPTIWAKRIIETLEKDDIETSKMNTQIERWNSQFMSNRAVISNIDTEIKEKIVKPFNSNRNRVGDLVYQPLNDIQSREFFLCL